LTEETREKKKQEKSKVKRKLKLLNFKYVNIQGLTKTKIVEIEEIMKNDSQNIIFILVETQLKHDSIVTDNERIINVRDPTDKKGGGIMLIYKKTNAIILEKIETRSSDILRVICNINGQEIEMVVVYFSVYSGEASRVRNGKMKEEVENIINNARGPLVVVGDFNGHISELGNQREDDNGRMIKRFINNFGMTLVNLDEMCTGRTTWQRGEQSSCIDFLLSNDLAYGLLHEMIIDEEENILDISDHKLMEVKFKIESNTKVNWKWKNTEYYSTNEQDLRNFREELETKIMGGEVRSLEQLEDNMKMCAESQLKRVYRRKVANDGSPAFYKEEKSWFNTEIRKHIDCRRRLNRLQRN